MTALFVRSCDISVTYVQGMVLLRSVLGEALMVDLVAAMVFLCNGAIVLLQLATMHPVSLKT